MESFTFESVFQVPAERLFEWHSQPGAFGRMAPPWEKITLSAPVESLAKNQIVEFKMRKGPLSLTWRAALENIKVGRSFTDVQVKGPFRHWKHLHEFRPRETGSSSLIDHIDYQLPGGWLGKLLAGRSIRRDLERTFEYRHRVLREDLNLHQAFSDRPRLRVAITGASGLIGTVLGNLLTTGGHEVVRVTRSPRLDGDVAWDPARGAIDGAALAGVDAVVHLAGENVAGRRWTGDQMRRICSSRIQGTRLLVNTLKAMPEPPRTLVSASAIGLYGDRGMERLSEESDRGETFLAGVCSEWESEALAAAGIARTSLARFGVVLSPRAGALSKMLPAFRLGAGGRLGSGRQMMSWISIDDAAAALMHLLLDESLEGPFNLTAPRPVSNLEFTRTLARVLKRPAVAPVPAFAARAAFGKMADEVLLGGALVLPERLESAGFSFRHPTLEPALRHLLGRS
jgi:uncharacterized protein (TIGR01777 family)